MSLYHFRYRDFYFKINSPGINHDGYACYVSSGGGLTGTVGWNSCGRSSPYVSFVGAYFVNPDGGVNINGADVDWNSCGRRISQRKIKIALRIYYPEIMNAHGLQNLKVQLVMAVWYIIIPTGVTISFVYHLYEKYNPVFRQSYLYYGGTYYD